MNVPFKKGLKQITGKKRHREALCEFRKYLDEWFSKMDHPKYQDAKIRAQAVRELIAAYERGGFTWEEIGIHYQRYRWRPRRSPRKKVKKKFDAKGLPKLTKTPLDEELSAYLAWVKVRKTEEKVTK